MLARVRELVECRVYFAMYVLANNVKCKHKLYNQILVDRDGDCAGNERAGVCR